MDAPAPLQAALCRTVCYPRLLLRCAELRQARARPPEPVPIKTRLRPLLPCTLRDEEGRRPGDCCRARCMLAGWASTPRGCSRSLRRDTDGPAPAADLGAPTVTMMLCTPVLVDV